MDHRSDLAAALARIAALQFELKELRAGAGKAAPGEVEGRARALAQAEVARARADAERAGKQALAAAEAAAAAALRRAETAERTLGRERETLTALRARVKSVESALELERVARKAAEKRAAKAEKGEAEPGATRASRTVNSRREAMWRQARLATLAPGALLATSSDTLNQALRTQRREHESYAAAGSLRQAAGGEPVLVHPRPAAMGFAEVRVGPGMGEILVTTQDAVVDPARPKRRKR
ncbi:MAG: hypothetical protein IT370_02805 [Deltaproteobacteria bacterium]|nr:hypothetical protein [Deltaproteobacteria bacterium]